MPVVLTTAAVGAGAYGVYRGGQAAFKKAQEQVKEATRERRRGKQRQELDTKKKSRQDRIAAIQNMRTSSTSGTYV